VAIQMGRVAELVGTLARALNYSRRRRRTLEEGVLR
tara:strand:- start:323 stop:430 length:108 start_codon:yes stop_codon:yes gene_type:complete